MAALFLGFKTRRILSKHPSVSLLRKDYLKLFRFYFQLQSRINQSVKKVSIRTKQLLAQSYKELVVTRKAFMFEFFDILGSVGNRWLK